MYWKHASGPSFDLSDIIGMDAPDDRGHCLATTLAKDYQAGTQHLDTTEREYLLAAFVKYMTGNPTAYWPCNGWPCTPEADRYRAEFPDLLAKAAVEKGYEFADVVTT